MPTIYEMKPCGCIDDSFIDLQKPTLKMLEAWVIPTVTLFDNMLLALVETGHYAPIFQIAENWISLDSSSTDQLPTPTKTLQVPAEWEPRTGHLLEATGLLCLVCHGSPMMSCYFVVHVKKFLWFVMYARENVPMKSVRGRNQLVARVQGSWSTWLLIFQSHQIEVSLSSSVQKGKSAIFHLHKEKAKTVAHSVTVLISNLKMHQIIHVWGFNQDKGRALTYCRSKLSNSLLLWWLPISISRQWKRGLKGVQMNL